MCMYDGSRSPEGTSANIIIDPVAAINEGGSISLSGSFLDEDAGQTHEIEINWGDGSPAQIVNLGLDTSILAWNRAVVDDLRHSLDCGVDSVASFSVVPAKGLLTSLTQSSTSCAGGRKGPVGL